MCKTVEKEVEELKEIAAFHSPVPAAPTPLGELTFPFAFHINYGDLAPDIQKGGLKISMGAVVYENLEDVPNGFRCNFMIVIPTAAHMAAFFDTLGPGSYALLADRWPVYSRDIAAKEVAKLMKT